MERTSRRTFLKTGAAGVGAAAFLGACDRSEGPAAASQTSPVDFDASDWSSVRDQFELDPSRIHLAAFVLASHPRVVRAAIERHRKGLDEDTNGYLSENEAALDEDALMALARYLLVDPQELALTNSTTMGLGLLYNGLPLREGDELLATTHDFYSTHEALRLAADRYGATFRKVPLFADAATATVDEIVRNARDAIGPRTRVLAITWVHSGTGMKLPIRAIADVVAEVNVGRHERDRLLLCVDGVHGFGNQDANAADLGCDFLVSGCHKWLFGPRGTGFIWGKGDAWPLLSPTIPSFSGAAIGAWIQDLDGPTDLTPGPLHTPGGYHSFEHRWALKEAVEFHETIGRDRVAQRTSELATRLKDGIAEIPSLRLVTPNDPGLSAGIVCIHSDDLGPPDILGRLVEANIAGSITPYSTQYVRLGPSIVTDEEDVDRTLDVLASL
jgi:selenocysteine lyase/cysteine desulfurase